MYAKELPKNERLLRIKDVMQRTGLSRPTLYRKMHEPKEAGGGFPRPVKLGQRVSAWPEYEVQAWIATQVARRAAK